ncbi:FAD-dependent oxidoreductase [Paenibacillus rigui]|uniref:FAD-dependent oxidoreductase n=1 Tax=Paenibacillus rigui TaxID=554312 RepID=A0A229UWL1_9BACL|nr:FAD-dependent oxidoreductase [Paenibacillus rigui]OXM87525.1 FAD-dependent oxidoreductase [Paenibacillus rigui]
MTQPQNTTSELPVVPQSYWLASTEISDFPALSEDIHTEVAVVGAGMTGIVTAYLLAKRGVQVALLEAGHLLTGTTGHTTAKITAQHDLIYDEFLSHFGEEQTRFYYEANIEALEWIKGTIREHGISCELSEEDAYIYAASEADQAKIVKEAEAYRRLGIPGSYVEQIQLPYPTKGAVVMHHQAQYHPLAFLTVLVEELKRRGVRIYEQTEAMTVEEGSHPVVVTRQGHKVHAKHVVSSTHYPFYGAGGFYFARMHPERSYAIAVKASAALPKGMYLSAGDPKRSLRTVKVNGEDFLILGGENHQTGQGICTIKHYEALQSFGEQHFGIREIGYRWSAQDLITLDKLPYIGPAASDTPNIFIATGYKKWGMTTSVAAALLLDKQISGIASPYTDLFRPSRFHADPSLRNFAVENADVAKHLIQGKLEMVSRDPAELGKDEGAVVRVNGKRAGAYRDSHGQLHLVDTTCTHMGCEVEWNDGERTWDCPCHGSRYSYQGEVLEGPAKKPLATIREASKV